MAQPGYAVLPHDMTQQIVFTSDGPAMAQMAGGEMAGMQHIAIANSMQPQLVMMAQEPEDEANKKNAWTKEEDDRLCELVSHYGAKKWSTIATQLGTDRVGKQCRERWHNHLSPAVRKDHWTEEEDKLILEMVNKVGTKWSQIVKLLPGRTDNAIKNRWNSAMRKSLRRQQKSQQCVPGTPASMPGFKASEGQAQGEGQRQYTPQSMPSSQQPVTGLQGGAHLAPVSAGAGPGFAAPLAHSLGAQCHGAAAATATTAPPHVGAIAPAPGMGVVTGIQPAAHAGPQVGAKRPLGDQATRALELLFPNEMSVQLAIDISASPNIADQDKRQLLRELVLGTSNPSAVAVPPVSSAPGPSGGGGTGGGQGDDGGSGGDGDPPSGDGHENGAGGEDEGADDGHNNDKEGEQGGDATDDKEGDAQEGAVHSEDATYDTSPSAGVPALSGGIGVPAAAEAASAAAVQVQQQLLQMRVQQTLAAQAHPGGSYAAPAGCSTAGRADSRAPAAAQDCAPASSGAAIAPMCAAPKEVGVGETPSLEHRQLSSLRERSPQGTASPRSMEAAAAISLLGGPSSQSGPCPLAATGAVQLASAAPATDAVHAPKGGDAICPRPPATIAASLGLQPRSSPLAAEQPEAKRRAVGATPRPLCFDQGAAVGAEVASVAAETRRVAAS